MRVLAFRTENEKSVQYSNNITNLYLTRDGCFELKGTVKNRACEQKRPRYMREYT